VGLWLFRQVWSPLSTVGASDPGEAGRSGEAGAHLRQGRFTSGKARSLRANARRPRPELAEGVLKANLALPTFLVRTTIRKPHQPEA
jgi:hypothetical protein